MFHLSILSMILIDKLHTTIDTVDYIYLINHFKGDVVMKKIITIVGLSLAGVIVFTVIFGWYSFNKYMKVKTIFYDKNLTIFDGGGGNSIVLTSDDGTQAVVVDTKTGGRASKTMAAAVKAKEIFVVNTHAHRDHVGGNKLFPNATLIAGAYTQDQWKALAAGSRYTDKTLLSGEDTILTIGNERVHIRNMGRAHTWNDVVVYLENRNFLMTGDLIFHHLHPAMYVQGGTKVASWVNVLDSLLVNYSTVKTVLPGHGALSDKQALTDMKEYFVTVEAAIGNPDKIASVSKKYKKYHGIPGLTSFDKTVTFIENENMGN
jgi:glyoxylase-like metal-dependent hydrolase (beta-lactamase superfamily II)